MLLPNCRIVGRNCNRILCGLPARPGIVAIHRTAGYHGKGSPFDGSATEERLVDGFKTQQVAELTGVNRKTLQYWDRSGFLSPTLDPAQGTGTRRLYSFHDVVAVRVAHQFRSRGISLQGLRRVVSFLQNQQGSDCPLAEAYLVTDGKDVYATRGKGVESVLRQPGQGCLFFVMDLGQIVGNLNDTAATLQKAANLLSGDKTTGAQKRKPRQKRGSGNGKAPKPT